MAEYVILLDAFRAGTILKVDGRRQYRFSFGPFQWERTTVFLPYLTEGTPVCGLYAPLSEHEALERLTNEARRRAAQLKTAMLCAKSVRSPAAKEVVAQAGEILSDWDERLTLYAALPGALDHVPELPPPVRQAAKLLRAHPGSELQDLLALRRERLSRQSRLAVLTAWYEKLSLEPPHRQDTARMQALKDARKVLMGDTDQLPPGSGALCRLEGL